MKYLNIIVALDRVNMDRAKALLLINARLGSPLYSKAYKHIYFTIIIFNSI